MTVRVAILGSTGAVGTEFLGLLARRHFPLAHLKLLASPRSAGKTIYFQDEELPVEAVTPDSFKDIDLVLASAGASVSKVWAPVAVEQGAVVIDNSSAFRLDPRVPLVVPEVNPQAVFEHHGIIANPNCTTILMCVAIYPLHQVSPIQRIVAATYQSASGAGAMAMQELQNQTQDWLTGRPLTPKVFPYPIAFNLFPHNSPMQDNHYCQEEMKMLAESRKIMADPNLRVTATCIRVPVLRAHAEALNLEFSHPFPVAKARQILENAPGITLIEDWDQNRFPMPIDVSGQDAVAVGRIRQDISHPHCLELWLCGDQIRKGAALNAIQIAEILHGIQPTAMTA
jgi:aspartate-semialdehyde dehydrogenase